MILKLQNAQECCVLAELKLCKNIAKTTRTTVVKPIFYTACQKQKIANHVCKMKLTGLKS